MSHPIFCINYHVCSICMAQLREDWEKQKEAEKKVKEND